VSAALEYGICYLKVKHLIILGHSGCGGIHGLCHREKLVQNDCISHWVSQLDAVDKVGSDDDVAKKALAISYQNCLTFPWLKNCFDEDLLEIHRWFFDIKTANLLNL
jgi:carbonic anhydrase